MSYSVNGTNIAPIAYGRFSGGTAGTLSKSFNCSIASIKDSNNHIKYTITITSTSPAYTVLVPIATLSSLSDGGLLKQITIESSNATTCTVVVWSLPGSLASDTHDVDNAFTFVIFGYV